MGIIRRSRRRKRKKAIANLRTLEKGREIEGIHGKIEIKSFYLSEDIRSNNKQHIQIRKSREEEEEASYFNGNLLDIVIGSCGNM